MDAAKVCLITGASSGIGAEIARHLASLGYGNLAIVARRKEKLEEVAEECRRAGAKDVFVVAKDLSDLKQTEAAVQETVDKYGRLDVVVGNSGMSAKTSRFRDMSIEAFQTVLNLNLMSQVVLARTALPHLEVTKGNIVFISSISAQKPMAKSGIYCTSKAALDMTAKVMAMEEAAQGVRVNVVSPGPVATDMFWDYATKHKRDISLDKIVEVNPYPIGDVGDVARLVAFVVDEKNKFLVGENIVVDGGRRH